MDASDFIYELRKKYEVNTNINKEFYEDKFLERFDKPYLILHFDHIDVDYKYMYDNKQRGGNIFVIKKYIEDITQSKKLLEETNSTVADIYHEHINILIKKLFSNIKEKFSIKLEDKIYAYGTKIQHIVDVFPKDQVIHNKLILSDNFSYVILNPSADIAEKYSTEYIYIILDAINKLKIGDDLLLLIYFSPWIDNMFGLYMILINSFTTVDFIFPTCIGKHKNTVFIVLKRKIISVTMPTRKFKSITIESQSDQYRDKMEKFVIEIFDHINFQYKLNINLNLFKLNNDIMYDIIKRKILSKLLL